MSIDKYRYIDIYMHVDIYRYLYIDIYVNLNRVKIFGPCEYLIYL